MKKLCSVLFAALLLLALLAGCTPAVPEGVDEESIKQQADAIIIMLNERDYDGIVAAFSPDVQGLTSAETFAESLNPILDALGNFEEITDTSAAGQKNNDGTVMPLVVVKCSYANSKFSYIVHFNLKGEPVGLFTAGA